MTASPSKEQRSEAKRRRWADVAVIVAAVYSILAAVWAPPEATTGANPDAVANPAWLFGAYGIGGALGLAGLLIARRYPVAARLLVAAGSMFVFSGFLAMSELSLLAALSLGGTGLLMLVASPFVGPMPSPEEEGRPRSGLAS